MLVRAVATAISLLAVAGALAPAAHATAPYTEQLPPLLTPWTSSVSTVAPLPEYPRPQLERSSWLSLNGQWQYEQGEAGQAPPFGQDLAQTILVPFPVESPLSGIEREDIYGWYRRTFTMPPTWSPQRVLLNFGAVGWQAKVYVNGHLAGTHEGDYDSFALDITPWINRTGLNELVVGFYDPIGAAGEPVGKQTPGTPAGILHTASSGIWQTVWLEPVSAEHITGLDLVPDVVGSRLLVNAAVTGGSAGKVTAQVLAGNRVVATATGRPGRTFSVVVTHPHLWSPTDPYLYNLRVQLAAGSTRLDRVTSFFGMRSISLGRVDGMTRILLNRKFVFESGALDQGYWPDGLYTPPADAAMRFDILAAKELGYNMIRVHQMVEPDRFYYWADKLGILVWQDMPALRLPGNALPTAGDQAEFRHELGRIVVQHRSDPSVVMWIPFNEGWDQFDPLGVTRQARMLDPSALVDTDSGSADCCGVAETSNSDVRDTHLYFGPYAVTPDYRASVIGEYGGVLPYPPVGHRWPGLLTSIGSPVAVWGSPTTTAFLQQQYAELTQEMRAGGASGAVFTELFGQEDELGIVTYDRQVFTMSPSVLRGLNDTLIADSENPAELAPQTAAIPPGTTGLWLFDQHRGSTVADASKHHHPLTLEDGAAWAPGPGGGALAINAPGEQAVGSAPVINTSGSFTVSAWLKPSRAAESGTAVSEPGPVGSSFSLGIDTASRGVQSLHGTPGAPLGKATWWTFMVPNNDRCVPASCGVRANTRYTDGREDPQAGTWYQVTGVYNRGTQTIAIYVNGVPEDVEHTFGIPAQKGPLTVGGGDEDYTPTDSFIGAISGLRTYARALTVSEVWQLYLAERPG